MDEKIFRVLNKIGVPCHLVGRKYIEYALKKISENPNAIYDLVKSIYSEIAKENGIKQICVERSIRNAIKCTFDEANWSGIYDVFGNCVKKNGRPDNKRFLAGVAEYIKHIEV